MSEWQPIEAAPKDGRIIQVRQGKWAPYHTFWHPLDGWKPIEFNGSYRPTHWLPEPPKMMP